MKAIAQDHPSAPPTILSISPIVRKTRGRGDIGKERKEEVEDTKRSKDQDEGRIGRKGESLETEDEELQRLVREQPAARAR